MSSRAAPASRRARPAAERDLGGQEVPHLGVVIVPAFSGVRNGPGASALTVIPVPASSTVPVGGGREQNVGTERQPHAAWARAPIRRILRGDSSQRSSRRAIEILRPSALPIRRWRLRIKSPRPGGAEYSVLALSTAVAGASSCGLDDPAEVPGTRGAFGVRRRCSRSRSIGPGEWGNLGIRDRLPVVVLWPIMCLFCISGGGGSPEPQGRADLCSARRAILRRPWAAMRLSVRHVRRPGG